MASVNLNINVEANRTIKWKQLQVYNDRGMSLWTIGIVSKDSEVVMNVCVPQSMGNMTEERRKGCVY